MTLPVADGLRSGTTLRWLGACGEVASVLAASRGLEASGPDILRILGSTLAFDRATLWLPRPGEEGLRTTALWTVHGAPVEPRVPLEGAGLLCQRAVGARRPVTLEDLPSRQAQDYRAAKSAVGVQGALAIPLLHGTLVHGVVELVRREPFAPDEAALRAADLLGCQIGQFASREEALAALRRTKRELTEVLEEAPVGIVVLDATGRILRVNRTGTTLLRAPRGALVGRAWRDLFEDRVLADDIWRRLEACPTPGEVVSEDVRMRAGDGSVVWVRTSMNVTRGTDGGLLRVRGFFRDVGAKVEAEASRRRSEERYLRLVTAARDYALCGLDERGAVTSWNVGAQRLYGWPEGAIVGQDAAVTFLAEDRQAEVPQRVLRLAVEEGEFHHEGWRVRQDGSRFWAHVTYTAVRDASGALLEISVLTRDATQQRRLDSLRRRSEDLALANREVVHAARRKEELLQHVLGAIQGPMREVESAARRLGEEGAPGTAAPAVTALLARLDGLTRAVSAIEDLLVRGAPDVETRPEALDLARLATEAREVLRAAAAERQVRVDVDVDPGVGDLVADRQMVRLILHNLLSNAVKFSRERSRVGVRILPEGAEHVRLEVEDAGIGLTEEEAARLRGRVPAGEGEAAPGLGLAATRRIVDQMGGRFGLQSTPGRGSVFFVVLPRTPEARAPERSDAPAGVRIDGPVLVVSEEPSTRASLCWTLGSAGLEVVAAARVEEALDACRERRFEAVAVDLALGDAGAVDLVTTLRAEGASRDMPWVIPCVGTRETGAAGLPVADLLPRPAPADRLFAALERAGVSRHQEREVLLVEGDPDLCRATARTLRILSYRVLEEVDGHAALKACAEKAPAAILLSTSVRGMDPFAFLHHLRHSRCHRDIPVFLLASREVDPAEEAALREASAAAARDGLWLANL